MKKGYNQYKLRKNNENDKKKGSNEKYPKMFTLNLRNELFNDLRGKLKRFITEVDIPFDKKSKGVIVKDYDIAEDNTMNIPHSITLSNDCLYENIKQEIEDIESFMSGELYKQKEQLTHKTKQKLKETEVLNDEYITMKLRENKDVLCSIHNIINQMNKIIELYKDLQKRINAYRINNDSLFDEIKIENAHNVDMIKNVFYYKSSIRDVLKNIEKMKSEIASYSNENNEEKDNKRTMIMTNNTFFNNQTEHNDNDNAVLKRIQQKKKRNQIKANIKANLQFKSTLKSTGMSQMQILSQLICKNKSKPLIISPYSTITSNINNKTDSSIYNEQKSTQYVSHLYQTINTFHSKKQTVTKVLSHQPANSTIYDILLNEIQKAEEHFKQINSISLKIYKTIINPLRLINEKGYRQMVTDALVNNEQIKAIMNDKSLPSITTYKRIIDINDTI